MFNYWIFQLRPALFLSQNHVKSFPESDEIILEIDPSVPINNADIEVSENEDNKAGLGTVVGQILTAPFVIGQALATNFGNNLQSALGLLNTTHNAIYAKLNKTVLTHSALFGNISAAHIAGLTNKTNAFLAHLETHKEIAQDISQFAVQVASTLLNSTANLVVANIQTHITVAELIINSTLQAKVQSINATIDYHQTILRGVSTLLEQKMLQKQLFYYNMTVLISNITAAKVYDLQVKVNETQLYFEYLQNKTLIVCDAITDVMDALLDAKNTSTLGFVAKTTVLLDTVADIVTTAHNITGDFIANKTATLLQSVSDVFDILANASVYKHEAYIDKFNTSIIAFTDSLAEVSASVGLFKANISESFAAKVDSLLESKAALHANISTDLTILVFNLTNNIAIKFDNLTTKLQSKVRSGLPLPADSNDRIWMDVFAGILEAMNLQLGGAVNATVGLFNQQMTFVNQQVAAAAQAAEDVRKQIMKQLDSTIQGFNCAQQMIPEYLSLLSNTASTPLTCSADSLTTSLTRVVATVQTLRDNIENDINKATTDFEECVQITNERPTCVRLLFAKLQVISNSLPEQLQKYVLGPLATEFQLSTCFMANGSDAAFNSISESLENCVTAS